MPSASGRESGGGMTARQEVQALVSEFFKRDRDKIKDWWSTPNPMLGELTPSYFAQAKGFDRLLKLVKDMLEGNTR